MSLSWKLECPKLTPKKISMEISGNNRLFNEPLCLQSEDTGFFLTGYTVLHNFQNSY